MTLSNSGFNSNGGQIDVPAGLRLWTDDYSSLFPLIKLPQQGF